MEYYSGFKRKKILMYTTTWMNLVGIVLSQIRQAQKTNTILCHLYEVAKVVKFTETERTVVTRDLRGGKKELHDRYRTTSLKTVKIANFMLCAFITRTKSIQALVAHISNTKLLRRQRSGGSWLEASPG
jgi:hypothetical protein